MTFTRSAHQFKPGRHVWVRPAKWIGTRDGELRQLHRFGSAPFKVTSQITINGWPHYLLLAPDGSEWQVSQLEVAGVPLGISKECVTLGAPRRLEVVAA